MSSDLEEILAAAAAKPAAMIEAARCIDSLQDSGLRRLKVSFVSSVSSEFLRPYLVVEAARRGFQVQAHFCPFNQVELQVFDANSGLYASNPELVILALRLQELVESSSLRFVDLHEDDARDLLSELRQRLDTLLEQLRAHTSAQVLMWNFFEPETLDAGLADASLPVSQRTFWSRANETLAAACGSQSSVHVFDLSRLAYEVGLDNLLDARFDLTARIPFGANGQMIVARSLARALRAMQVPPCKCLVVDLDNTLWGGVLGEGGVGGIALSEDYPGNAFKRFQERLALLRAQGVWLAIASKNNESDVVHCFENHRDMVLSLTDFAATQIHWQDKASSLLAIAGELNIGLDAIAFFDDSAAERQLIRRALPEVVVIEVPADPGRYVEALEASEAFDRLSISTEDRQRAAMAAATGQRATLRQHAVSIEQFLEELQMRATVGPLDVETLGRVEQLLSKTNQFNLTTRRHTAAQLQDFLSRQGGIVLWLRLEDRFGDEGVVGVAIALPQDADRWRVDSFLLSCRVIGRQVEVALLESLASAVLARGGRELLGEYLPTAKNMQVAGFYAAHDFKAIEGDRLWLLDLRQTRLKPPSFIEVHHQDAERTR